jgi:hypothetical protein
MTVVWASGYSGNPGKVTLTSEYNGITDPDAQTYLAAVEAADGQALEGDVALAINDFVVGCKLDGIWDAIKASCILAGARTLSGALVPLKGAAPTNNNFVSGDYNRETGLVGDGSTKYLNSNRANSTDPQNNFHMSVWVTAAPSGGGYYMASNVTTVNASSIFNDPGGAQEKWMNKSQLNNQYTSNTHNTTGLKGTTRNSSSTFLVRTAGSTLTPTGGSLVSLGVEPANIYLFARNGTSNVPAVFVDARFSFYSIGENLDLALLDNRVSTLMTDIGAAIP